MSENGLLTRLGREKRFVCYSPVGRGILSGKNYPLSDPTDYRRNDGRFEPSKLVALRDRLNVLWDIAKTREKPPAAVALAWLLSRASNVHVIPGPKTIGQLEDCISAVDISLTTAELARLDEF